MGVLKLERVGREVRVLLPGWDRSCRPVCGPPPPCLQLWQCRQGRVRVNAWVGRVGGCCGGGGHRGLVVRAS